RVVLRRGAQHCRAADIDVLDRVVETAVGVGDGRLERIQVDGQQVDGRDAGLLQRRGVRGIVAAGEQAAVGLRVQGLDAAVEHFREAGVLGNFGDLQAFLL